MSHIFYTGADDGRPEPKGNSFLSPLEEQKEFMRKEEFRRTAILKFLGETEPGRNPEADGSFEGVVPYLAEGRAVARPNWLGYWILNEKTCQIEMHLKDGSVTFGNDTNLTVSNVIAKDWYVLTDLHRRELDAIHEAIRNKSSINLPTK